MNIFLTPVISEKSLARIESFNEYTFRAPRYTSKAQVKEVIEKSFGVKVLSVHTKVLKAKAKRSGKLRRLTQRLDSKHVTVKLDKKDKISLFEIKESKGGDKK